MEKGCSPSMGDQMCPARKRKDPMHTIAALSRTQLFWAGVAAGAIAMLIVGTLILIYLSGRNEP